MITSLCIIVYYLNKVNFKYYKVLTWDMKYRLPLMVIEQPWETCTPGMGMQWVPGVNLNHDPAGTRLLQPNIILKFKIKIYLNNLLIITAFNPWFSSNNQTEDRTLYIFVQGVPYHIRPRTIGDNLIWYVTLCMYKWNSLVFLNIDGSLKDIVKIWHFST